MLYLSFRVGLLSLSIMSSRFLPVGAFLRRNSTSLFVNSSVHGRLSGFHLLTMMHVTAMNMGGHVSESLLSIFLVSSLIINRTQVVLRKAAVWTIGDTVIPQSK